jgi:hypothetical protein
MADQNGMVEVADGQEGSELGGQRLGRVRANPLGVPVALKVIGLDVVVRGEEPGHGSPRGH